MDKHLNDLIVGVPNHIESYSNQKVFVREKEDNKMAKRTELKCPLCGVMLCKCASAGVRAESSSGTVKRYILQKKNPFAIL